MNTEKLTLRSSHLIHTDWQKLTHR